MLNLWLLTTLSGNPKKEKKKKKRRKRKKLCSQDVQIPFKDGPRALTVILVCKKRKEIHPFSNPSCQESFYYDFQSRSGLRGGVRRRSITLRDDQDFMKSPIGGLRKR
jgi:hypothetical protein